jgi:hypothetical protein
VITNEVFTVTFTISDGKGYWSTNGADYTLFTNTQSITNEVGTAGLWYYSDDGFGNISSNTVYVYTWDFAGPVISIGAGPAGDVTTNEAFDITLTNSDGTGYWSTNGTNWNSYIAGTNITILEETEFLLFFGIDALGNVSVTNSNAYVWIYDDGPDFNEDEFFKFEPEYFFINNGENILDIYLNFPDEYTEFSVEIYNENSSLVRTLDGSSIDAANKLAQWDGKDEYGNHIAGIVYIRITAQSGTLGEKIVTGKIVALEQ